MWFQCEFQLSEVARKRLFGGNGESSGRSFRQLAARLNDERSLGLPEGVWHYQAGHALGGVPLVRFGWSPKGVRLSGIGTGGARLAREAAPILAAELMRSSQSLIGVHHREGTNTVGIRPMPVRHFAPSIVVSRDSEVREWLSLVDEARHVGVPVLHLARARAMAESSIREGLLRQLHLHLGEQGTSFESDDDEALFARQPRFDLKVTPTASRHFLVHAVNNTTSAYLAAQGKRASKPLVGLVGVEFTVNAVFNGVWSTGRLQSQGYGVVLRSRVDNGAPVRAVTAQADEASA